MPYCHRLGMDGPDRGSRRFLELGTRSSPTVLSDLFGPFDTSSPPSKLGAHMHDVVIIGAGPAGLHAARLLSQRNLDVLVLEEHDAVGRPVHCTGILARSAFREFDLPEDTILGSLHTARFISPAGRDVVYRQGRPEAVIIDREAFDVRLGKRAAGAGARILCGTRVAGISIDAGHASIDTTNGSVHRAR